MCAKKDLELLLISTEENYDFINEIVETMLQTDSGLDDEDLKEYIEERDALASKIRKYKDKLGIETQNNTEILKK